MSKGKYFLIIAGALILLGLFIYPKLKGNFVSYSGDVPCLASNLPLVSHIHPHLSISVDGRDEALSAEIGLSGVCERSLHTHAADGVIHAESQVVRDYTLGQFFEVWGKPIQREGYKLEMTVDVQPNQEYGNLALKDGQNIVLKYKK